jgi:hypothetical protein
MRYDAPMSGDMTAIKITPRTNAVDPIGNAVTSHTGVPMITNTNKPAKKHFMSSITAP